MLLDKRHFSKLALADQISALPVAFSFYMVYDLIRDMTRRNVLGFTGLITSSLLADFIKRLPFPESWHFFTLRPKGANNWDILSKNDYSDKINPPGFPSGHLTNATYFSAYIYLSRDTNKLEKLALLSIILLTAWARYVKGVHNIPQILGGILLGLIVAKGFVDLN